jgi:transcriptional regulator with XRE-family HTH domain
MVMQKSKPSLRQLAKELGISHSYLSQVLNGKRPTNPIITKSLRNFGIRVSISGNSRNGKQILSVSGKQNDKLVAYQKNKETNQKTPQSESKCARSSVDRASVFETGGRGFESLQAHHYLKLKIPYVNHA